VFVRAGYTTNAEEMGFAAGCGFKVQTATGAGWIDYAYTDFGIFNCVHRISVGISF